MPRGTPDPEINVPIYQPDKAFSGTTILADNHNPERPRIIEVNMMGEILWQYLVPQGLRQFTNPGFDIEPLASSNVLFVLPRAGVYEVNRKGEVVWSYLTDKISHDADRLPNGNTMLVFGADDQVSDAQVKEVNSQRQIIWSWYARDHFYKPPFSKIYDQGWTHTNAASRLPSGNTLISMRNFNFIAEVDAKGAAVGTIGEELLHYQHDPEVLPNDNILVVDHSEPHRLVEIDTKTGQLIWEFKVPRQLVRDTNRLPNGNILITGGTIIIEITPQSEVVWRLELKDLVLEKREAAGRGFYKAERIAIPS
ncbi:aryl-sulfate sulfotransferase [Chloroflexota bacterium]